MPRKCDILVIGAGVVGLSTGIALLQSRPNLSVIVADKEKEIGMHASGRNSGVIHAGFYYSPDSLKAKFCRDGNFELRKLAKKYGIPVKDVGKVVVTRNDDEDLRLNTLFERGIANGVELEIHSEEKLKNFEPLAITHNRFLWSPNTGISDSISIVEAMRNEFIALGGEILFSNLFTYSVSTKYQIEVPLFSSFYLGLGLFAITFSIFLAHFFQSLPSKKKQVLMNLVLLLGCTQLVLNHYLSMQLQANQPFLLPAQKIISKLDVTQEEYCLAIKGVLAVNYGGQGVAAANKLRDSAMEMKNYNEC